MKNTILILMLLSIIGYVNAEGILESVEGPVVLQPANEVVEVKDILKINPRNIKPSESEGTIYWSNDSNTIIVYDGMTWNTVGENSGANMIGNPSAETIQDNGYPMYWNRYRGCGNALWGSSNNAHTGEKSVFIQVDNYCIRKDNGREFINIALYASKANGYSTLEDLPAKADTEYIVTFWAKTELPYFNAVFRTWKETDTSGRGRTSPVEYSGDYGVIYPEDNEWHQYKYKVKTRFDTGYMSPYFHLNGYSENMPLDTPLIIDDITLEEVYPVEIKPKTSKLDSTIYLSRRQNAGIGLVDLDYRFSVGGNAYIDGDIHADNFIEHTSKYDGTEDDAVEDLSKWINAEHPKRLQPNRKRKSKETMQKPLQNKLQKQTKTIKNKETETKWGYEKETTEETTTEPEMMEEEGTDLGKAGKALAKVVLELQKENQELKKQIQEIQTTLKQLQKTTTTKKIQDRRKK